MIKIFTEQRQISHRKKTSLNVESILHHAHVAYMYEVLDHVIDYIHVSDSDYNSTWCVLTVA